MGNIVWNTKDYANNFSFVASYGESMIDMIDRRDGMTCLDLGCGNGRLTGKLKNAGFDVIGMDDSADQIRKAREDYPDLIFRVGNAVDFTLEKPVDVIFSNAVFHWIDAGQQPKMLQCIFKALKPGGQLVFEMGGKGNNALIHGSLMKAFEKRGRSYHFPFYFPSIGEYAVLMEQAGFLVRSAVLFDRKTPLAGPDGLYDWMRMFVVAPFRGIPEEERTEIYREVVEDLRPVLCENGQWFADYVRLRCKAVRQEKQEHV